MHAELMELNDRLQRALQNKEVNLTKMLLQFMQINSLSFYPLHAL